MNVETPIIALTANVMSNDQEIYIKNGINECLGKPFTSQELWACLLKYLKPADGTDATIDDINESEEKNNEFLNMLKHDFYVGNKGKFAEITSALEARDIRRAYLLVHTLKSNAALVGRPGLYDIAVEIERQLADGKRMIEKWHIERLDEELETTLRDFAPLLEYESKPLSKEKMLDQAEVTELFKKLKPLLSSNNSECLDYINKLYRVEGSETLVKQIENYDFITAAKTLAKIERKMEEQS
jgi:HPt (histidine-containing phosphotransfer) domain-containing protein